MKSCAWILAVMAAGAVMADAAAPANDNFASRQVLSGAAVSVEATNVGATMESGESYLGGLYGATVWYSWTAPVAGWVRVETTGSEIDTVLRVTTGAAADSLVGIGYNDDDGEDGEVTSSLTFQAVAGQMYNLAVGGMGGGSGAIALRIASGEAALPPVILSSVTLRPAVVDVTEAAAEVAVGYSVVAGTYNGEGVARWSFTAANGREIRGDYESWDTGNPGGEGTMTVPKSFIPGEWALTVQLSAGGFRPVRFGGSESGAPYVFPVGGVPVLTVRNSGGYDAEYPVLRSITVGSLTSGVTHEVSVAQAVVTLPVRVELTDDFSGVDRVEVGLEADIGGLYSMVSSALVRTAGTEVAGVWTGLISVSSAITTGEYRVFVVAEDKDGRRSYYNDERGGQLMPGGELALRVLDGSGIYALWRWGWSPVDDVARQIGGVSDDPDGDGVNNLLCMAFDLNPFGWWNPGSYLPEVTMTGAGGEGRLRIRYARRKDEWGTLGLSYVPQFGAGGGVWEDASAQAVVTELWYGWEEVVVTDTVTAGEAGRRFGRVKVTYSV
jgi:hypothetical protein